MGNNFSNDRPNRNLHSCHTAWSYRGVTDGAGQVLLLFQSHARLLKISFFFLLLSVFTAVYHFVVLLQCHMP